MGVYPAMPTGERRMTAELTPATALQTRCRVAQEEHDRTVLHELELFFRDTAPQRQDYEEQRAKLETAYHEAVAKRDMAYHEAVAWADKKLDEAKAAARRQLDKDLKDVETAARQRLTTPVDGPDDLCVCEDCEMTRKAYGHCSCSHCGGVP
jgi:dsDNA-specific endonuclease/ATPase MutS2